MSSQLESIYSDELILLAETLGEVKTRTEKLEGEFSTHAKPLEAATNALSAALSGIKALQFHVLDNNLGALSARVEEMRKAVDEQVGVIALELKKADETNAAKAGADAEALRSEIVALQSQLGSLVTQFGQQLERVEFAAKEEAKKLELIPGPAGAAGASLNPRGTFIDGEVYNRLDVVSWLGSSYIATVDGVTEKPSKNSNQWQTLASRGGGGAGGVGDFGSLAGVAQINQGGTGQTTRAAGLNALLPDQAGATQYMLLTDGSGTVSWGAQPVAGLPSQTSNSGRLLTTNGSTASWSNAVTVSGSNATVGGSLTVSGTTTADGLATSGFFGGSKRVIAGYNTSSDYGFVASVDTGIGWKELHLNPVGGVVKVPNTAASTTTSSGALVVSGGIGVAGAINAGGAVNAEGILSTSNAAGVAVVGGRQWSIRVNPSSGTRPSAFVIRDDSLGSERVTIDASGNTSFAGTLTVSGSGDSTLTGPLSWGTTAPVNALLLFKTGNTKCGNGLTAGSWNNFVPAGVFKHSWGYMSTSDGTTYTELATLTANTGVLAVLGTTASNNTSSGALVVSGGVGVAGNTNIGGALRFHTNTALPGTASISKDATFGLNFYASTGSSYDFTIFNAAGTGLLVNPTGTSALTAFDTFTATGTLIANAASNAFRITTAQTPASAGATGTAGTICWDTSYIYVCTATNTWKRVAISTW